MTNLVEILKNAPKGLELYSPVYGKVKLNCMKPNDSCPIEIEIEHNSKILSLWLDKYGRMDENGECTLFPSKENRDWNNWQKTLIKVGHFIALDSTLYGTTIIRVKYIVEWGKFVRFATTEEIEQWYRETAKTKEEPTFTINDFKPFDKVLVRAVLGWKIELFATYHKDWNTPYECLGGSYDKCVPYNEETKSLLSTFIEYNGKYKTW